jgi:tripartite-type tricarboxylate transporter receptor subunit TctC
MAMQSEPMRARLAALAAQGIVLAPEAFAARNAAEYKRMGALIRETGLLAK